ncbi:GNAT family N-acetyltransferase [Candidatus Sumerlaeota bacterium]|nr:GNAT family N-acetyltransferase [Candidatus Sumerlaeota bacterium]
MSVSGVTIRAVKGNDVSELVSLWNRTLIRDTITEQRFVNWLFVDPDFDPLSCEGCWVAEKQNTIVGFARAIIRSIPNDGLGLEVEDGWIPVIFVAPEEQRKGIGSQLMEEILKFFKSKARRRIWVCGNTGSAPGYIFPGVDKDAYRAGLAFFKKWGFVVDHEPVAMARSIIDFEYERYYKEAWAEGTCEGLSIESVTPETVLEFLAFMRRYFPGDWNIAARAQLRAGKMNDILIARLNGEVVGYCQWDGEHFGPFGVREDVRGKRIGAKLFVEAVRRIKADDGRSVWFNWADPDAARFYKRFGLDVTRRFAILRLDI